MMGQDRLETWEGVIHTSELDALLGRVSAAMLIGQRAGAFALGRSLDGGASSWSSGRCFNEQLEIRWWPAEEAQQRSILILNQLPEGWVAPESVKPRSERLATGEEEVSYLCVGRYDTDSPEGIHEWWESRYGRTFSYLNSAPPGSAGSRGHLRAEGVGRIYLRSVVYEFEDGRIQHRLMRFEHADRKEVVS